MFQPSDPLAGIALQPTRYTRHGDTGQQCRQSLLAPGRPRSATSATTSSRSTQPCRFLVSSSGTTVVATRFAVRAIWEFPSIRFSPTGRSLSRLNYGVWITLAATGGRSHASGARNRPAGHDHPT